VVRLERNYRSTQSILDVASAVVRNNRGRLGKELVADREGGEPVTLRLLEDQLQEARFVADLVRDGRPWSTAVLYRANHQSRAFEAELSRQGVGYRIVGTVRFFDRAEVKDAVAYLALLLNPRDELAFARVVNHPTRGVGKKSQERVLAARDACGGDLTAASARVLPELPRAARTGLQGFLDLLAQSRERLESLPLAELVDRIVESSGLLEYYRGLDSSVQESSTERVDNLRELASMAAGRPAGADGLCALLEEAALDSGAPNGDDRSVTLITLHNTKGLEFDRVVITGLEDGVFPLVREGDTDVEEERRLFYVGITRARNRLYLTSCRRRRVYGRELELPPSRFLQEIPLELLAEDSANPPPAEDEGFPAGCAVYHESYGRGVVVERPAGGGGGEKVVVVRFETGKTARFVLRFSGLERIAHDDP
jgi:DNA helicase-2/ATP-dependent DNA helicase PcrA